MSANTKIEWADHTFNPWIGCTKVSPGCDNCYAKAEWDDRRHRAVWGPGNPRSRTKTWGDPKKWNDQHEAFFAKHGRRQRVFCASLADVFDNEVPEQWRADLLNLIADTPQLDWLLLTKRIGNAKAMLDAFCSSDGNIGEAWTGWPNVWIGATVVNQKEADRDIPKLLAVPAAKRFLSMEPLLGPVNLWLPTRTWTDSRGFKHCDHCCNGDRCDDPTHRERQHCLHCHGTGWGEIIDWVIVGGESGHGARPMHPDWARNLRDQCRVAGVPFLFKQHGEWLATAFCDDDMAMIPSKRTVYVRHDGSFHDGAQGVDFFGGDEETAWVGKKAAGRLLDGRTWDEVPA